MPSPGIEPLSALTRRFTRRFPGIMVDAAAAFTPAEVVDKVRQGVCELGLVGSSGPISAPGVDVLPLEEQPFVLVGGPDVDFPDGDPVPHAALSGARMIVSPAGSLMRQIVDDLLAEGADMQIVAEVAHRTSILPAGAARRRTRRAAVGVGSAGSSRRRPHRPAGPDGAPADRTAQPVPLR